MIRSSMIVVMGACLLMLGACQTDNWGGGETIGTLGGGAAGGLVGNAIGHGSAGGTLLGVLIGGVAGNLAGGAIDDNDKKRALAAQQRAYTAPVGQQITWNNPSNGNSGAITPVKDGYNNSSGSYCREFQQSITVNGQAQQGYGTACQQPDGSWKIVQ